MTAKEKVVVILGPTATGKTACGILLAQKLKGEIISGDSMLVFRGMCATRKKNIRPLILKGKRRPSSRKSMGGGICPSL